MPLITIKMNPGRTDEQKALLAAKATDAFMETCAKPGQSRNGIWVVIEEVAMSNWAIGGKMSTPPPVPNPETT